MRFILRHRPMFIAALVSMVGILAALYQSEMDRIETDCRHIASGLTESWGRAFDTIKLSTISLTGDADKEQWKSWSKLDGYNAMRRYAGVSLPTRHMLLMDRNGVQQFTSFSPDVEHRDYSFRPYFKAMKDGADSYYWGPFIGGNTGRMTYSVTMPLYDKNGEFDGLVMAAVDVAYLDAVCRQELHTRFSHGALLASDGTVVSSCDKLVNPETRSETLNWKQLYPELEKVSLAPGMVATNGKLVIINRVRSDSIFYAVLVDDLNEERKAWTKQLIKNVCVVLIPLVMLWLSVRRKRRAASTIACGRTTSIASGSVKTADCDGTSTTDRSTDHE